MPTMRSARPSAAIISVLEAKMVTIRCGGPQRYRAVESIANGDRVCGRGADRAQAHARQESRDGGMSALPPSLHPDDELTPRIEFPHDHFGMSDSQCKGLVERYEDRVLVDVEDVIRRGEHRPPFAGFDLVTGVQTQNGLLRYTVTLTSWPGSRSLSSVLYHIGRAGCR